MAHEYCMKCGGKNQYEVQPPKFCSACGISFNAGNSVQSKAASQEEEEEINEAYDVRSLANDWVADTDRSQFPTLGELMTNPVQKGDYASRPSQFSDMTPQEVVQRTMSDCSSVREMKELG